MKAATELVSALVVLASLAGMTFSFVVASDMLFLAFAIGSLVGTVGYLASEVMSEVTK